MDNVTADERSRIMASVRSRGNRSTEAALSRAFRKAGVRGWRRQQVIRLPRSELTVRPDFVFPERRLVVFVDGCLWHLCPVHARIPASNRQYWIKKLQRNVTRDRTVDRCLRRHRWKVVRIWEHSVKKTADTAIRRVNRALKTQKAAAESGSI